MSESGKARETQINRQKSELTESIDILEKSIDTLEDRLNPVLTSISAGEGKDEVTPDTQLVPLATFLRTKRKGVAKITNRVESITQRLEL